MIQKNNYRELKQRLDQKKVKLVAVSKTHPPEEIKALYDLGQRDFGENKAQELIDKQPRLPEDIRWHFIGHLQRNKVKYLAPFIHLIHSVDSIRLLREINKQARKQDRTNNCLLQVHIAEEASKHGFSCEEVKKTVEKGELKGFKNVRICGLMGMATLTEDIQKIRKEFRGLYTFFQELKRNGFNDNPDFRELSMGMTSDYKVALEAGTTIVRAGTLIFGPRKY